MGDTYDTGLLGTRAFFAGHCGRLGRLGSHRPEPGLEDGACRQSTTTSRHSQSTRSCTSLGCSDAKVLRRSPSDADSRHLDKDSGAPTVLCASSRLCVAVRLSDRPAMTWTSRQIWPGRRKTEYVTQKASVEPACSDFIHSTTPLFPGPQSGKSLWAYWSRGRRCPGARLIPSDQSTQTCTTLGRTFPAQFKGFSRRSPFGRGGGPL